MAAGSSSLWFWGSRTRHAPPHWSTGQPEKRNVPEGIGQSLKHFLIARLSLVCIQRELIAQVKHWTVSLSVPGKLCGLVAAPGTAAMGTHVPSRLRFGERLLRCGTKSVCQHIPEHAAHGQSPALCRPSLLLKLHRSRREGRVPGGAPTRGGALRCCPRWQHGLPAQPRCYGANVDRPTGQAVKPRAAGVDQRVAVCPGTVSRGTCPHAPGCTAAKPAGERGQSPLLTAASMGTAEPVTQHLPPEARGAGPAPGHRRAQSHPSITHSPHSPSVLHLLTAQLQLCGDPSQKQPKEKRS